MGQLCMLYLVVLHLQACIGKAGDSLLAKARFFGYTIESGIHDAARLAEPCSLLQEEAIVISRCAGI